MSSTNLKIGILANEFLDPDIGRMGGFGWAARNAGRVFKRHPQIDIVYLSAQLNHLQERETPIRTNGIPLHLVHGQKVVNAIRLFQERIDLLLTIDYRPNYNPVLDALPFTPIVTWVRDPRPPEDVEKMMSLRIPGKEDLKPDGIHNNETIRLAEYTRRAWPFNNTVLLANKMPHMKAKNTSVYGVPPSDYVLPNPSVIDYSSVQVEKADTPTVVFLGRLDPIKRPWLFVELGRHFPQTDFYMMGQNHFEGERGWRPNNIPDNVHLTGHLSGADKYRLLSRAWVLVNTSIHEESPVSVLEALAYETPVLSYEDWGRLVERHGITIGQHRGTGMDGMPDLVDAQDRLLTDHKKRIALGKAGRSYVEQQHNDQQFLAGFSEICKGAGIQMNMIESR